MSSERPSVRTRRLERVGWFYYHQSSQRAKPASRAVSASRTMGGQAVNIQAKARGSTPRMSSAEWQARVDLAAVYRLVARHGWDDVIYNHCSMRVPGEDRKFLMKQHELLWTEVTASTLVKVSMDEDLDERAGVNRPRLP